MTVNVLRNGAGDVKIMTVWPYRAGISLTAIYRSILLRIFVTPALLVSSPLSLQVSENMIHFIKYAAADAPAYARRADITVNSAAYVCVSKKDSSDGPAKYMSQRCSALAQG